MPTAEALIAESFASPPADWRDAARAQSLYLDAPYLRYASRDHGEVFRAELRTDGALSAGVTGWVASDGGHPYLAPRKLVGLPASEKPDLVLGCPGAFTGDMLHVREPTPTGAAALATGLARHAEETNAGAVLALYADHDAVDFWSAAGGPAPALVNFDTVILVPGSFDAWLEARPRQRRSTLRRELRAFERAGFRGGVARSTDAELPELLGSLATILVSSEARFGNAMQAGDVAATLERQRLALGDAFALFYVRDPSGRIVAGATAFLDSHAVHMRWGGVDREHGGRHEEYFHIGYYLPIRFAGETGRRRVHLGMESFEAKLLRGAHLEPRFALAITPVEGWAEHAARASAASVARLSPLLARFPDAMSLEARARLAARLQLGDALARMRA